jgi:hypothetical protein
MNSFRKSSFVIQSSAVQNRKDAVGSEGQTGAGFSLKKAASSKQREMTIERKFDSRLVDFSLEVFIRPPGGKSSRSEPFFSSMFVKLGLLYLSALN